MHNQMNLFYEVMVFVSEKMTENDSRSHEQYKCKTIRSLSTVVTRRLVLAYQTRFNCILSRVIIVLLFDLHTKPLEGDVL